MSSSTPVTAPILKAVGIHKTYGEVHAVAGVSLSLERGSCLALLGPNGAGKTTTLEILEGLTVPDAGSVEMFGETLVPGSSRRKARVGVLLQETALYKRYTVEETLTLFASFYPVHLPVRAVLEQLQLIDKAKVQLRKLSGGQKQRVYLACALINDPELLFLDEPTTGLDPQSRRATWDILQLLKKQGKSQLLTTHYMDEAEQLADQIAIVDHGKIIVQGTPRGLIEDICGEQRLSVAFAGDAGAAARAMLQSELGRLLPWFSRAVVSGGGYEVHVRDAASSVRELFAAATALGLYVSSLNLRQSTLEDVFLQLTGRALRDD